MPDLSLRIGKLKLKNPLMVASGTFGYAEEFSPFLDLKKLGAIVSKTVTLQPREGNPAPRTCETPAGMLNSIGLENPGVERFLEEKLPQLNKYGVPVIVSISSEADPDEFIELARRLNVTKEAAAIELNISCPNIRLQGRKVTRPQGNVGRRLISQDAKATFELVKAVRKATAKTLITKLSPNVTDITEIALAAEKAGSDAVALVNTISAMCVDTEKRRPKLAMITGGLSGPAIRPIAVRMCWEAYQKIRIPIIGMGGIMDAKSALEFFIAGACAISIGTANFINPRSCSEILEGIKKFMVKNKIKDLRQLTGSLKI